jgi:FkbM family methyltransferase
MIIIFKKIINALLSPIFNKLGYVKKSKLKIVYKNALDKNFLLENLITIIKNSGFRPTLIIDIGANHGTWSRVWKARFPETSFVLVEPQEWLKPSFVDLLDDKTVFLPVGAGKENGTVKFTINSERDDSSTFALSPNEAELRGFKQIDVEIKTLNTVIKELGNRIPEIVKIDAEGIDIDVLEGASDLIGKTEIFLVEASINSSFTQTELSFVVDYMNVKGYRAFEITDINRPFSNNVLWLVEIAFVRKGGFFDNLEWIK